MNTLLLIAATLIPLLIGWRVISGCNEILALIDKYEREKGWKGAAQ